MQAPSATGRKAHQAPIQFACASRDALGRVALGHEDALLPNVDRWILSSLSSPALVSSAVNMMSGPSPVTAECALNELAKQGFTATVVGP